MLKVPLKNPSPDFENLEKILKGERQSRRVHFVEQLIDSEIMKYIVENYMNRKWVSQTEKAKEDYQEQVIDFYYKMGYDFVPIPIEWKNFPQCKARIAKDTATLSRGERSWVEEREGIIKSWDDFEKIDWDNITPDLEVLDYAKKVYQKVLRYFRLPVSFK